MMGDFEMTDAKLDILNQFKEILNESDDDIARATLESVDWDLIKAIEASSVHEGAKGTTGSFTQQMEGDGSDIIGEVKPTENMAYDDDMSMDSSSITGAKTFSRNSSKADMMQDESTTCSSSAAGLYALPPLPSRTSSTAAIAGSSPPSVGDNLSVSSVDYFSASGATADTNGVIRKAGANRDDSGSGSTCSLTNNTQPSTSASNGIVIESVRRSIPISTERLEDSDDDADYHYSDGDDDIKIESSNTNAFTDQIPLVPTEYSSVFEAVQNFSAVFEARYGPNFAPFYPGSLTEAASEAFEAPHRPILERRPLAIYLHNDSSVAANIFAQHVMCSDAISSLLKCQFVLWGWDMSQQENRQKLYSWMTSTMSDVADNIKLIHRTKYPLLIILVKDRGVVSVHSIAKGHDDTSQTVEKLMSGLDYYLRIKNKDTAEEMSRIEREQIRQEQVEEYEKALAVDRARQREQAQQREREREEEVERDRLAEQRRQHLEKLSASLSDEPPASETEAVTIRMRFPSGETKIRRFRMQEPLKMLVTFVESIGFDMESHRIWTSDVPKKDVATLDASKSFAELKWPRREQVTVDEK